MRAFGAMQSECAVPPQLSSMLDHFRLSGPNGTHDCLVLELLGQSVPELLEARHHDHRLPGHLAKRIAKQALIGLDFLHQQYIAHGDIHTRNLVSSIPNLNSEGEEELMQKLKSPVIGAAQRKDGRPLEPGMPEYLVRPTHYPTDQASSLKSIRIIDFGESFFDTGIPDTLHTPLVVRAPEIIFHDRLDFRVDLWTMGCMSIYNEWQLFELVTGQPPFDSFMVNPTSLIRQVLDSTGEELPERWQPTWRAMESAQRDEYGQTPRLQPWLEELYFDGEGDNGLTREDIAKVGELIRKMLQLEPLE
ncbi:MAG: hypothetical protein Q9181_005914 [Wetmoreana brouardii]